MLDRRRFNARLTGFMTGVLLSPGVSGTAFGQSEMEQAAAAANAEMDAAAAAAAAEFDQAIRDAFAEFDAVLAGDWGEARQMPAKKIWVGYPNGKTDTRIVVDYEKGEMSIETVDESLSVEDMESAFAEALEADSADLNDQDMLASKIRESVSRMSRQVASPPPSAPPKSRELSRLVDATSKRTLRAEKIVDGKGRERNLRRLSARFIPGHQRLSADQIKGPVKANAKRFGVPEALILAVIKNESAFNPRAQSPVPAFGLMQLVPSSGGHDALRFVTKMDMRPSPDLLFQVNGNIELGTAYLHILLSRYLRAVKNRDSRIYCSIAAYNTGAGNVAKAFTGSTSVKRAAKKINAMSPDQVYDHLVKNLPYEETRKYLPKVYRSYREYGRQGFDT